MGGRSISKVAFIGLGVMGSPMAGHLARSGLDVTVYNRTASKAGHGSRVTAGAPPPRRARRPRAPTWSFRASETTTTCARSPLAPTGLSPGWERAPYSPTTRRCRRTSRANCMNPPGPGLPLPRRAGLRGPVGSRERSAQRDGRRRYGYLREGEARDGVLRTCRNAYGRPRRRAAHQDGEPDRHRGAGAGARRGDEFRLKSGLDTDRVIGSYRRVRRDRGSSTTGRRQWSRAGSISASPWTGCARICRYALTRPGATGPRCRLPRSSSSCTAGCRRKDPDGSTRRAS